MKVDSIEFTILSPEIIKKMAVAKITKTELYDEEGYPIEGGIMDPRLGVVDPGVRCRTCGGGVGECQGHFGYLELIKPVLHVHYAKVIYTLLKIFCRKCSRILIEEKNLKGLKNPSFKNIIKLVKKKCPYCNSEQKKLKFVKPYTIYEDQEKLDPIKIRERFEKIRDDDLKILNLKFRPEWLIITLLPIPPVTVRPSITLETGERSEDDLTHKLVEIVRLNDRLRENLELGAPDFIIDDWWELMQYHVATLFDNEISGIPPARHRSGRVLKTLSQRLKTKEGRFRGNLAGKRVNFSARTVISPDCNISIDEVGIPEEIAKELTIPERVNERNIEELRKLILNAEKWPGVNYIIKPDGRRKKVTELNKEEVSKEIMPGYIVERHLKDGDIVLFNRQPSLHRMSIMAHKVKVLPGKTFRLNIATCPPYNADFDGDEMNLHVPQTEEARGEAEKLLLVEFHVRSPRYSAPIIGAVHDHISGLYLLTKTRRKFSKEEVVQLVRSASKDIEIPDKKQFTGKEIFSLFLPKDFNIEYKTKFFEKCSKCKEEKCKHVLENDSYVIIKNGKLVYGAIDKNGIGAEGGRIIDKMEKEYGSRFVINFLNKITSLALNFITNYGFSISIADLDYPQSAQKEIENIVKKSKEEVYKMIEEFEKGRLDVRIGKTPKEGLETLIKRRLGKVLEDVRKVLEKELKETNTLIMAKSGARGDFLNLLQTSALVGQEMSLGERMERGYYGRSFPHFKIGDKSVESKGFVGRGFKHGLTPFEFFFDAINSRESLMDKSLKTRHSGYMERRLVGALQDLKIEYDGTVRDSSKRIIQFLPGEDGLDPSKIRRIGFIDVEKIAERI